jgi:hypothetical protein
MKPYFVWCCASASRRAAGILRELLFEVRVEPVFPGPEHRVERSGAELAHNRVEELGREGLVVLGEEGVGRRREAVSPHGPTHRPRLELTSHQVRRLEPTQDRSRGHRANAELSGQLLRGQRPVEAEPLKNLRLGRGALGRVEVGHGNHYDA